MKLRLSAALGLLATSSTLLSAQQGAYVDQNTISSMTMVSDTRTGPGVGVDNPLYLKTPGAGGPLANYVNLLFDRGTGFSACTGTMLNSRQILTAAHCVSNGTSLTSSTFFARFRTGTGTGPGDWITVQGSGYAVRDGYTGQVIDERDVAVLTIDSDAPAFASGESLSQGSPFTKSTIGGYGLYGVIGSSSASISTQFTNEARVRTGFQLFETTCITGGFCAGAGNPLPVYQGFGGVLLADADLSGLSGNGFACATLGFCNAGYAGFEEVGINRGDSGSAAFDADGNIIGVASWGSISSVASGSRVPVGGNIGYACVANYAGNQACQANYQWIQRQLISQVPEPGSLALLGLGLAGLVAARRRRAIA